MREARGAKAGPRFSAGAGKIFAYTPTPHPSYAGRAIPRYRPQQRLHIPKFRQPKRLSRRASAFSSPVFTFLPRVSFPFPCPPPLSPLARRFPFPLSPLTTISFLISLILSTFLSLSLSSSFWSAQCASENMNPSPHCLRQRFSNFPPLCANDEGTKGEIKSRGLNECEKKRSGGGDDDGYGGHNLH